MEKLQSRCWHVVVGKLDVTMVCPLYKLLTLMTTSDFVWTKGILMPFLVY